MEGVGSNGQLCSKVGKTMHYESRMRALSSRGYGGANGLRKKYAIHVDDVDAAEAALLAVLSPYRIVDESYTRRPQASELFDLDPDIIEGLMGCFAGRQVYPSPDASGIEPFGEEPVRLASFVHCDDSSPNLDRVISLIRGLRGALNTDDVRKLLSGKSCEGFSDLINCLKPMVSEMELGLIACFFLDETRDYRFRDPQGYSEVFGLLDPRNCRARILAESILRANGVNIGNSTLRRHSYAYRSQYEAIFEDVESHQIA